MIVAAAGTRLRLERPHLICIRLEGGADDDAYN